eukprot:COSAG01_NODE_397_length_17560_cov_111.258347_17_plen_214_part_00
MLRSACPAPQLVLAFGGAFVATMATRPLPAAATGAAFELLPHAKHVGLGALCFGATLATAVQSCPELRALASKLRGGGGGGGGGGSGAGADDDDDDAGSGGGGGVCSRWGAVGAAPARGGAVSVRGRRRRSAAEREVEPPPKRLVIESRWCQNRRHSLVSCDHGDSIKAVLVAHAQPAMVASCGHRAGAATRSELVRRVPMLYQLHTSIEVQL